MCIKHRTIFYCPFFIYSVHVIVRSLDFKKEIMIICMLMLMSEIILSPLIITHCVLFCQSSFH